MRKMNSSTTVLSRNIINEGDNIHSNKWKNNDNEKVPNLIDINETTDMEKNILETNSSSYVDTQNKEKIENESIIKKNEISNNDNNNDNNNENYDDNDKNNCRNNIHETNKNNTYRNKKGLNRFTKNKTTKNEKENLYDINFQPKKEKSKDEAIAKYKKGDYEGALQIWERGLRSIEYVLSKKDELNGEKIKSFEKLHSTYCSNIAQGYMKLNNYSNCVKYSLEALKHDKENEKIYFRLGKGYYLLGEYDKSIQVLHDAIKIKNDPALINLLAIVKRKKELHLIKEKFMMKHIFQSLEKDPLTNIDGSYNSKDEKKENFFFNKILEQIYYVISFFMLLLSLFMNQCYALFSFPLRKSKKK